MSRRKWIGLVAALTLVIAGGVVGYVVWRHGHSTTASRPGTIKPVIESPVFLRVLNQHGAPVVVSGYTGDRPHVLKQGEAVEVSGIGVPTPWHTVITDAATHAVLYDKQLPAGSGAMLIVSWKSAAEVPRDREGGD